MDLVSSSSVVAPAEPMSERHVAMIAFESQRLTLTGDFEAAVRARFGCSIDVYYVELNEAMDHPDALELDPLVVRRFRRNRERRRRLKMDAGAAAHGGARNA